MAWAATQPASSRHWPNAFRAKLRATLAQSKLRIGIVGTGGMANMHAEQFSKIKGVVLASCLDVVPGRAQAFAQKHGVARAADQLEDLLAEVDAVALVTPDRFHAQGALQVLQ